jgi:ribosomal protein L44E
MALTLEAMFCFVCNTTTEHIVRRWKSGEIKSFMCRRCKHKETVGSNSV